MSDEKTKTKPIPKIVYVDFRSPVPVGVGEHASIEYWSDSKHGKKITCEERGNWIILGLPEFRIRVPMTNVGSIKERE